MPSYIRLSKVSVGLTDPGSFLEVYAGLPPDSPVTHPRIGLHCSRRVRMSSQSQTIL